LPDMAAHCYRDMPFVLTPCFWSRFAAAFRQSGESRERSHGDGMLIHLDSPEALEEVLWKAFWRGPYRKDRIEPWGDRENDEFEEFFRDHMRKIIRLRRGAESAGVRYLSKNNLNIARVGWLRRRFPDATVLVPFRDPLQHAASLLEQHENFLAIHEEDAFACEYMRAIGHFDFGRNLRPVDFDDWLGARSHRDACVPAFWLEYWVSAYRHLLRSCADFVHFVHYEELCRDPARGLRVLADVIGTRHPEPLLSAAAAIRPGKRRDVDTGSVPESLLEEAGSIHAALEEKAVNRPGA